jgi:hypothetical protein
LTFGGSCPIATTVYDADKGTWMPWTTLELPEGKLGHACGAGCTQRVDLSDGTILLHTERHGLEALERPITLVELKRTYSIEHYQDALKQLAALGLPTPEEYAVR